MGNYKVWFSLIVLIFVQSVFANDVCHNTEKIRSCDQCIRCGGNWCSQKMDEHCISTSTDDWCGGEPEELLKMDFLTTGGKALLPSYVERTIFVGKLDNLRFSYVSPVERKVSAEVFDTSQNLRSIALEPVETTCDSGRCNFTLEAKVHTDFCTGAGSDMEFIYVNVMVDNITEQAAIKYHVPCACECTKKTERMSAKCNTHGDWACGVCLCYDGWSGEDCKISLCEKKRGDVQCNNPLKNDVECSGNGYCGPCDSCICYTDREGSQYFDSNNYCSDICLDTNGCGQCLTTNTNGECINSPDTAPDCNHPMTIMAYNETITAERDYENRKIWVSCNDTFVVGKNHKCYVEYVAMKEYNGHINVMVVKSCNDHIAGGFEGTSDTKVPVIVVVVSLVAAVAAAGGVFLWRHLHAAPPMPFSSPDYQNIDAEDCVGENPLYKSPTTTFTNPQFGKC